MEWTIKNERLNLTVSGRGGEMRSILGADGTQYLWQGDPAIWNKRAPNLFPYIARLTEGKYVLGGKEYHMNKHGFLSTSELTLVEKTEDCLTLRLTENEESLACYPFHFVLLLTYRLRGDCIEMTFEVQNKDTATMYFGLGGHPGFCVPLESGLSFEDYVLEFSEKKTPMLVGVSDTCFINGEDTPYPLEGGRRLPLTHSLFDRDALIFRDMAKEVTLRSDKGTKAVTVSYPDMNYVGIWQMTHTKAPYVCIEPWTSLPSRDGIVEDLATQPDLLRLPVGQSYQNRMSVTIRQ